MSQTKESGANVIVLSAGMVGTEIAIDMAKKHQVTSVDIDPGRLDFLRVNFGVNTREEDLSVLEKIPQLVAEADIVAMALPGDRAYRVLEAIVAAGRNVVDASFFQENPFDELDKLARKNKVIAVVQEGIAPGVLNMPAAYHLREMEIETVHLLCGGLPLRADNPLRHTFQFHDKDNLVLWHDPEHIRNGKAVKVAAYSGFERVEMDDLPEGVGYLEAANTAGVATSLAILKGQIKNMTEKSLRHPGHIEAMKSLNDLGFFEERPLEIAGYVSPREVTVMLLGRSFRLGEEDERVPRRLLRKLGFFDGKRVMIKPGITVVDFTLGIIRDVWKPEPNEGTMTVARVELLGRNRENGEPQKIVYEMVHHFPANSGKLSLSPNTAFPATAVAQAILEGRFDRTGVSGPEHFAMHEGCFEYLLNYLRDRGIDWKRKVYPGG